MYFLAITRILLQLKSFVNKLIILFTTVHVRYSVCSVISFTKSSVEVLKLYNLIIES